VAAAPSTVLIIDTSTAAAVLSDSEAQASEITDLQVQSTSNGDVVSGVVTGTTDITVTPEPHTWLLSIVGVVGLLALRGCRRHHMANTASAWRGRLTVLRKV